jgi:hypothetical protein
LAGAATIITGSAATGCGPITCGPITCGSSGCATITGCGWTAGRIATGRFWKGEGALRANMLAPPVCMHPVSATAARADTMKRYNRIDPHLRGTTTVAS